MKSKSSGKLLVLTAMFLGCFLSLPAHGLEYLGIERGTADGSSALLFRAEICTDNPTNRFPDLYVTKGGSRGPEKPASDGTTRVKYSYSELAELCENAPRRSGAASWRARFPLRVEADCASSPTVKNFRFFLDCSLVDRQIVPGQPVMCCDDEPLPSRYEVIVGVGRYSQAGSLKVSSSAQPAPSRLALASQALPFGQGGNEVDLDDYDALTLAFTYRRTRQWGLRISGLAGQPEISGASWTGDDARLRALDVSLVRFWPDSRWELFSSFGVGWQWLELDPPGPGEQHLDSPTLDLGVGLTVPLNDRWFVRPETQARWVFDDDTLHWGVGVGIGLRFGGPR